jgi:PPOX class probable F420-dependent enzyme
MRRFFTPRGDHQETPVGRPPGLRLMTNRRNPAAGASRRKRGIFGSSVRLHRFVTSSTPSVIPSDYASLLERPLYGHLGTIRPDDTVQVNPMWFEYSTTSSGEHLRFTHTIKRAKFRNLQHNPAMSLSIIDPDNQFRYLELRGKLVDVEPDPTGAFYVRLGRRYGNAKQQPPPDSADRVVLVMRIEKSTKQ